MKKHPIVYSTDPNFNWDAHDDDPPPNTLPPSKQTLRIHLDRLKGNKVATRIAGFVGQAADLEALAKALKSHCGCGGTAKDGDILLQGEFRDRVKAELERLGYRCKLAGG